MEILDNQEKMKPRRPRAIAFGVVVLGFGLALLLRNMDLLPAIVEDAIFSWQMLLIGIGTINYVDRNKTFGLVLMVVGGVFLIPDFFNFPVELHKVFWPAILILIGIVLIMNAGKKRKRMNFKEISSSDDTMEEVAIFGGLERNITGPDFKGGRITTIFGGAKINLSKAMLAEGTTELEITCIFGGVNLLVPPEWNVVIQVTPIFGGFADKRFYTQVDHSRTLVIKGETIFGGGEIKSY